MFSSRFAGRRDARRTEASSLGTIFLIFGAAGGAAASGCGLSAIAWTVGSDRVVGRNCERRKFLEVDCVGATTSVDQYVGLERIALGGPEVRDDQVSTLLINTGATVPGEDLPLRKEDREAASVTRILDEDCNSIVDRAGIPLGNTRNELIPCIITPHCDTHKFHRLLFADVMAGRVPESMHLNEHSGAVSHGRVEDLPKKRH